MSLRWLKWKNRHIRVFSLYFLFSKHFVTVPCSSTFRPHTNIFLNPWISLQTTRIVYILPPSPLHQLQPKYHVYGGAPGLLQFQDAPQIWGGCDDFFQKRAQNRSSDHKLKASEDLVSIVAIVVAPIITVLSSYTCTRL